MSQKKVGLLTQGGKGKKLDPKEEHEIEKEQTRQVAVSNGVPSEEEVEFDVDDTIVQSVDGVLLKGDEEEVRMLFFHYKPHSNTCKAIAEFRTSRRTFNLIAQDFNGLVIAQYSKQDTSSEYSRVDWTMMYA